MSRAMTVTERAASVLGTVRELFSTRILDSAALQKVGIDFDHGGCLTLGDPRLNPVIREAGLSPDCGTEPIDLLIVKYLNNHHGFGRWKRDREAHPWERGGNDSKLEQLLAEEDSAIADRERLEGLMWQAWDEKEALLRKVDDRSVGVVDIQATSKALDDATKAWERAREREQYARGQTCNRQAFLQERWLRKQSGKGA